jgi:hypothetical protein
MNITVLTCTGDRPEAFALAEKYMKAQAMQPTQWIVLDDGIDPTVCTRGQTYIYCPHLRGAGSMIGKLKLALESDIITGDALALVEDDDFYHPQYLSWCRHFLTKFDLVGEGLAMYYNVRGRFWFEHTNMLHASLCSTSMTRAVFPAMLKECDNPDAFIDSRIWAKFTGKKTVVRPNQRLTVGIKAMPGREGYGSGHGNVCGPGCHPDPRLKKLSQLIGEEYHSYEKFYAQS